MIAHKPFYYLRHGETDWNRHGWMQGHSDVPLNATGVAQAEDARAALASASFDRIVASPLERARHTAEIVNRDFGKPIELLPGLKEASFGENEGRQKDDWLDHWRAGASIPGAEDFEAFLERARAAINAVLAGPGVPLIVAHGGVYWTVQRHCCVMPERSLPNCLPVYHRPPSGNDDQWAIDILGAPLTETA